MADKDIIEDITFFEFELAQSSGLTPEEVHLAIKLGVSPDAIMAVKDTRWQDRQRQITEEGERHG